MLPLDTHAHLVPEITREQLADLDACVVAVTRSPDEFESVKSRRDPTTIWALGCHPGLVRVQKSFSATRFTELMEHAAVVGEVGLDGTSRAPLDVQRKVLVGVLNAARTIGRIVSAHNYRATAEILEDLEQVGSGNVILHWWLGTPSETKRAVALGCFFSVNASSVRRTEILAEIPLERLLTETDHPFGDRWSPQPRRPGRMEAVEKKLASWYGIAPAQLRLEIWRNFGRLVRQTGSIHLFPERVQQHLREAVGA
jgi:TatD DNase family protein